MPLVTSISWISSLWRCLDKVRGKRACDGAARIAVSENVRAAFHEDGIAILNLSTGKVFLSNETGSLIWRGLVAGLTPEAIQEKLSREFGVGTEVVGRHTSLFLSELEERGLVTRKAVN